MLAGGLSPYHAAVLALLSRQPRISVVVVGANDGKINDPLFELIRSSLYDRVNVLLVEPQKGLLPILEENYDFVPAKRVVNCAVGETSNLRLFTVKEEYWNSVKARYAKGWPAYRAPTGVASATREHLVGWVSKHLRGYHPDDVIEEILVPSKNLGAILREQAFPEQIDVLQIDVEGNDDTIIYNANLPVSRPAIIHFEIAHLPPARKLELGLYLSQQGYEITEMGYDCLAIRQQPLEADG